MSIVVRTHQRDLETTATAWYSECDRFRYLLKIDWDESLPIAAVVGLNPSTATERVNDPTITRLERWARRNGFGSLAMLNAYAYRSTDPNGLWDVDDPVGPKNDEVISLWATKNSDVVAAWGVNIREDRETKLSLLLSELTHVFFFKLTKDGHPSHPLYLSDATLDAYDSGVRTNK